MQFILLYYIALQFHLHIILCYALHLSMHIAISVVAYTVVTICNSQSYGIYKPLASNVKQQEISSADIDLMYVGIPHFAFICSKMFHCSCLYLNSLKNFCDYHAAFTVAIHKLTVSFLRPHVYSLH